MNATIANRKGEKAMPTNSDRENIIKGLRDRIQNGQFKFRERDHKELRDLYKSAENRDEYTDRYTAYFTVTGSPGRDNGKLVFIDDHKSRGYDGYEHEYKAVIYVKRGYTWEKLGEGETLDVMRCAFDRNVIFTSNYGVIDGLPEYLNAA